MRIRGLIPATLTPFGADGGIDHPALAAHIARVGSATGLFGIAVNGHAGEVLALSDEERQAVIKTARKATPSGLKLVAGIESHSIEGLVQQGLKARDAGADMLLVIPPLDVRVYRHMSHVAEAVVPMFERLDREVQLPMIVFQYPEAAGCAYSIDVLQRIAQLEHVVAVKASAGSPAKYAELHDHLDDKLALLPAADSPSLLGMLLHGAPGSLIGISVVGTQQWSDLVREATEGDARRAKQLHNDFAVPLMRAIFEYHMHWTPTCPFGATKEALVQLGEFPSSFVRAPGIQVSSAKKTEIAAALRQVGLLQREARQASAAVPA